MTIGQQAMEDYAEQQPFIEFYLHPVKDANQTLEKGHNVYKDVEFARITPIGDPRSVVERKVTDDDKLRFKAQYEAWKAGVEAPVDGTDLKNWPQITPAELKNCHSSNVRSVEQLAGLNESGLMRIGMGARALKEKAVQYLKAANSNGKMAEEMSAMKAEMKNLKDENKELREFSQELKNELDGKKKGKKKGN